MDSFALWILKVMKPARKVVTRSPHREVGFVAGAGLGKADVEHESHLEKSFVVLSIVSGFVQGLESQPFKIKWTDPSGSDHLYTPDYRVTLADGNQLVVEIKPARFIEQHRSLFDDVTRQLRRAGLPFFVLTDKHFSRKEAEEAQLWRRYRHSHLPNDQVETALELVQGGITLAEMRLTAVPMYVWYGLLGRGAIGLTRLAEISDPSTRLLTSKELSEHDDHLRFTGWFGCSPWKSHA